MSRIYFHTPSETVDVYGTERAWLAQLCRHFASGIFRLVPWELRLNLMPESRRLAVEREGQYGIALRAADAFDIFCGGMTDSHFTDGEEVFACVLNTMLRCGSRPMALAARIHGQCEIHGYVEPCDGEFIASSIEEGLRSGVFRETHPRDRNYATGWREACRVLRGGETVVTSYSVCEGFPNQDVAIEAGTYALRETANPDEARDDWYELPVQQQWNLGIAALRSNDKGLRWQHLGWDDFYFGSGKTALDYAVTNHVATS